LIGVTSPFHVCAPDLRYYMAIEKPRIPARPFGVANLCSDIIAWSVPECKELTQAFNRHHRRVQKKLMIQASECGVGPY
jgi:hypothetical protein